jgi:hypothetical protein
MSTKRHSRRESAPKPVIVPVDPDMEAAKKLPLFGPGIVITIPLNLWPAYKELHHLELPGGYNEQRNILRVKRVFFPNSQVVEEHHESA